MSYLDYVVKTKIKHHNLNIFYSCGYGYGRKNQRLQNSDSYFEGAQDSFGKKKIKWIDFLILKGPKWWMRRRQDTYA